MTISMNGRNKRKRYIYALAVPKGGFFFLAGRVTEMACRPTSRLPPWLRGQVPLNASRQLCGLDSGSGIRPRPAQLFSPPIGEWFPGQRISYAQPRKGHYGENCQLAPGGLSTFSTEIGSQPSGTGQQGNRCRATCKAQNALRPSFAPFGQGIHVRGYVSRHIHTYTYAVRSHI